MLNEQSPLLAEGDSFASALAFLLLYLFSTALLCRCGWVGLSTLLRLIGTPTKPVSFVTFFGLLLSFGSLFGFCGHLDLALQMIPLVSVLLVALGFCSAFWRDREFPFLPTDDSATDNTKDLRNETSTLRKYFNEYTAMLANKVRAMGLEIHAKEVAFDELRRASAKTVAALKRELAEARKQAKAERNHAREVQRHYASWKKMELRDVERTLDQYRRSLDAALADRFGEVDQDLLERYGDKFLFGERLRLMGLTDRQKIEIADLRRRLAEVVGNSDLDMHISEKLAAQERVRQLEGQNSGFQQEVRQLEHASQVSAAEAAFLLHQMEVQGTLSDKSNSEWELLYFATVTQLEHAESNSRDLEVKLQALRREMDKSAESQEKELSRAQDKAYRQKELCERMEAQRDQARDFHKSAEEQRRAAVARAESLQAKVAELTKELQHLRSSCCLCSCPCCPDGCSARSSAAATPAPASLPVPSPSPSPELALLRQELARLRAENEALRQPVPSSLPSPEVALLHQELARLRDENDSLRQQTATLSQENNVARGLMGHAEGQWTSMQEVGRRLESDLAAARQEAQSATARANQLADQLSRQAPSPVASPVASPAAPPVAPTAEQMLHAQQQIDQLRRQVEQAEQKVQETLDQLDAANANLHSMRTAPGAVSLEERNQWNMERGQLLGQIDGHDAIVARLTRERDNAEADTEEAVDNLSMANTELEKAMKAHDREVESLNEIIQDISDTKDIEIEYLESEVERLEREIIAIRAGDEAYTDSEDEKVVETFDDFQEYE